MLKWQTGEPARIKKSTMAMAIILLVLACTILNSIIPKVSANNEQAYIEHTVECGQTLWDIAVMYRSDADPRQVIYEIKKASGCDSVIYPGQVVRVPK